MSTPRRPAAKKTAAAKATATPRTPAKKTAAAKKAPAKRAPRKAPAVDPRDQQTLELRRAGVPFDAIATQLKYPAGATEAHAAYERALEATLPALPTEARRLEVERLERLRVPLWAKAMRGDLAALDRLVRIGQEQLRVAAVDPLPVDSKRVLGPIEQATAQECARLATVAPALAAAALVLARVVDDNAADPNATATAARELRMTMSQLRGLSGHLGAGKGDGQGEDGKKKTPAKVTQLDQIRARARGRGTS